MAKPLRLLWRVDEVDPNTMFLQPAPIILPREMLKGLGNLHLQTRVTGMLPVNSLGQVTTALGQALPTMLVFSRADVNDAMTTVFQMLFTFAVSIAGLAFVAGAVLIANATGLTMVERRREDWAVQGSWIYQRTHHASDA